MDQFVHCFLIDMFFVSKLWISKTIKTNFFVLFTLLLQWSICINTKQIRMSFNIRADRQQLKWLILEILFTNHWSPINQVIIVIVCVGLTPCKNNGSCIPLLNEYKCICRDGFQGRNCEVQMVEMLNDRTPINFDGNNYYSYRSKGNRR